MKRKQLFALLVVAAVLVIVGMLVSRNRSSDWRGSGKETSSGKMLPDFPINDVTKVEIKGPDKSVTLAREEGRWRVQERYGYPVNYENLKTFMVDLSEASVAQTVKVGPSQYGRLELAAPGQDANAGTEVVFYDDSGQQIRTLRFGKQHEKKSEGPQPSPMGMMGGGGNFPNGRYILLPEQEQVVLVSNTFSSVKPDASSWIDKDFFKIGDVKQASLSEDGNVLWTVSRESKSGSLKLEGPVPEGKEVDTGKLSSIKSAFSWASFTDIADPELSAEATGMDSPRIYAAREFDGMVYTVRIGKKTDDGKVYLQAEAAYDGPTEREPGEDESAEDKKTKDDEFANKLEEQREKVKEVNDRLDDWTYIVSSYTVDSVLKTRDELLKDKPKPEEDEKADGEGGDQAQTDAPPAAGAE